MWASYYFGYITLAIFVKKRVNLQLGWVKFIVFATLGYLIITILPVCISVLFGDPLADLFFPGAVNYVTPGSF